MFGFCFPLGRAILYQLEKLPHCKFGDYFRKSFLRDFFVFPSPYILNTETSLAEVSLQDKILIQSALNSPRSPNASFSQTRQNVPSEKSVSRGPYTKTTISRRPFLFEGSLLDRILNGDVARSSNEDKPVHSKVTNNNNADNSDLVEPTEPDLGTFRIVCADVAHGEVSAHPVLPSSLYFTLFFRLPYRPCSF